MYADSCKKKSAFGAYSYFYRLFTIRKFIFSTGIPLTKLFKMATDVTNPVEDAEMSECGEDKVVTMMDVLQEQQDFEEDANAVLGASDDKNCTYSKGYIKRQALYACMTCCSEAKSDLNKRAGLCLACSLTCHENHELIELYTKRNFRCDCGNSKFSSHPCQLSPNKAEYNEENSYNQNFSGLYCICHRPYPDPDSKEEDVMIQCTICEDWYHGSHLETTVPGIDNYTEMICKECMEKNEFLHSYSSLVVNVENTNVDVVNVSENGIKTCNGNIDIAAENDEKSHIDENVQMAPEASESSPNDDTAKHHKQDGEENSIENVNVPVNVATTVPNNIEKFTSESKGNCNDENTENYSDNSNEENAMKDEIKEDNLNQIKNDMKITQVDSKETDPDATNTTIRPRKEGQNNNATEMANNKLTQQDKERMEEDRLLADPESQTNIHLDNTKTTCEDTNTTNEKNNTNENKEEVNILNTQSDLAKSDKKEPVKESTENITKSDEDTASKNHGDNANDTTINDMKGTNGECSQDKNMCRESDTSKHQVSEKRKHSTEENLENTANKKTKLEEVNGKPCSRPRDIKKVYNGATFWPSNFRQKLCTCRECLSMYKDLSILFLMDTDDTVIAYESLGKEKTNGGPSQYEKGLEALSSLDRIQQINALTEYNRMRDKLLDFLKSFKDRKEIVKEEDIKAFFAGMKPKREPDGVYFCR